jgi:hypothetical protein
MQKTDLNTALAIFLVATAVIMIGGLAVIPTTMQSASANHREAHGSGGASCAEHPDFANQICAGGGGGTGQGGGGAGSSGFAVGECDPTTTTLCVFRQGGGGGEGQGGEGEGGSGFITVGPR